MHRLLLFFLLLLPIPCSGQPHLSLSVEEKAVVRIFLHSLLEDSEAGYVFFNQKPLCIDGFYCNDPFNVNSSLHRQSVALKEGARIWKGLKSKSSNLKIHICSQEEAYALGYIHILAINLPLFHQVISRDLSLFQYALSADITSDSLLNALLSNRQTFHALLNNDKVLIGKILGFGLQSSLYGSRIENIQESFEKDTPPFLPNITVTQEYEEEYLPFKPSLGFSSLQEELNHFQKQVALSSEKLLAEKPGFTFGWLKESTDAKELVVSLEITQRKIQKSLAATEFLEKILQKFTGENYRLTPVQHFAFAFDKEEIVRVIAKGLWRAIQSYDLEYLSFFIEGMKESQQSSGRTERLAWFPNYRRELLVAKKNLEEANAFFRSLHLDKKFQCILPNQIYYKTLKEGQGSDVCSSPYVSLNYTIFSPIGHCLAHMESISLNLKNTLPSFAHALQGMKRGETREIWIHPSLAYGFETSLEKCIHLRAIVTLLESKDRGAQFSTDMDSIDLSFVSDSQTMQVRDENYKRALAQKGADIAKHLRKCRELNVDAVIEQLKCFYKDKDNTILTTQAEQDLINQVHWNIYFSGRYSRISPKFDI